MIYPKIKKSQLKRKSKIIVIYLFTASICLGAQWTKINGSRVEVKEARELNNGQILVKLLQDLEISTINGNVFKIYHKTDRYLKQLYPVIKKDIYMNRSDFSYDKFLSSNYACDIILQKETGAILNFTSKSETVIDGYKIPEGINVNIKYNSVAWIVDKEILISNFSLNKFIGDRIIILSGKKFDVSGRINKGTVKIGSESIQGIPADIPVAGYKCKWENGIIDNYYGMSFDKKWNILAGKLHSGEIHGFKEKLIYIFSITKDWDGIGKINTIMDEKGNIYYGYDDKGHKNLIRRKITWNSISLIKGDTLSIENKHSTTPEKKKNIIYRLKLKNSRVISLFNGKRKYYVNTKKNMISFYGNLMPESFTAGKNCIIKSGNRKIIIKAGNFMHFFKNGNFKSGIFQGIIPVKYKKHILKLYHDISFYKNNKIQKGILAEKIKLNFWGKPRLIPKNTIIRFSPEGDLETLSYINSDNKTIIMYIPEFNDSAINLITP